jgi:hypothetical protein
MANALTLIGLFGTQLMYNTYLAIGTATDDYVAGDAKLDDTIDFLNTQNNFMMQAITKLDVLTDGDHLTENDAVVTLKIQTVFCDLQLLAVTAKMLFEAEAKTAETQTAEDFAAQEQHRAEYTTHRAAAWAGISELMGFN